MLPCCFFYLSHVKKIKMTTRKQDVLFVIKLLSSLLVLVVVQPLLIMLREWIIFQLWTKCPYFLNAKSVKSLDQFQLRTIMLIAVWETVEFDNVVEFDNQCCQIQQHCRIQQFYFLLFPLPLALLSQRCICQLGFHVNYWF